MTLEEALLQYGELVKLHGPYSDEAELFLQKEARLNPDVLWNELFEYSMIVRLIHQLYHRELNPTFTSTVNQLDQQTATAPQYGNQHEQGCTFLGQYEYFPQQYDLWWGPDHGHGEPTLIARWSPDGPDYSSGLCFGWIENKPDSPLVEARRRAEARGLDVRHDYYAGQLKITPDGWYCRAGTNSPIPVSVSSIDRKAIIEQKVVNNNLVTTFREAFFCDGSKMHDGGTLICPPVTGTQREQYQSEDLLSETVTRFSTLFWDRGELTVGAYPAT